MSFTALCDKNIEAIVRNEFEAEYLQGTIDLILETIEGLASSYKSGELYVPSYQNYAEICNILKYRHPEEYRNMVEHVRAREALKEENNE